ncbi:DUF2291 domain-containing protein [Marispirochaeta sp.]|uniref:DUF2291 family protein n=1 Tax=Marispirochaeta sp. TaxID=2038653 RepID=UPI0029C94588|nr:DUF2291 domain-containing protein [Marispirochaeta sp.]
MIRLSPTVRLFCLFLVAGLILGCTIVRHDEETNGDSNALTIYFDDGTFNAKLYVDSVWEEQVLPRLKSEAVELNRLLEELARDPGAAIKAYGYRIEVTAPFNFMVKGKARISEVNLESAAATVSLDKTGPDSNPVQIQIGPVLKGTAIRDSMDFISFEDFTNQLEFANVSREMNNLIKEQLLTSLDRESLEDSTIEFLGAFQWVEGQGILITPVQLRIGGE